ncbi:MAG TPA: antibiotic biosynthesis monooxygenase, partial [Terriglobales bacterium]|nr:antibiotic biosynthesis monooxygenase [Terriglobales bacterium]
FKGDSPEVAEKFARADPYVTSGLVKRWQVREWTTVAGEDAAKPIRPAGASLRPAEASATEGVMVRMWKGRTTAANGGKYIQHLTNNVFPELRAIAGYRGVYLLRRRSDAEVEFVVLTLWDSMEAIRKFAGPDAEKAVVAPQARAVLSSFDDFVQHYEVVERESK